MIKVPSYKIKNESKIVVEDLKTENCEDKICRLFIEVKTLKKWLKNVDESSADILEKTVYKVKNQDSFSASKKFLNATEDDFEKESYQLLLPIPLLNKWVEDINRSKRRI